MSKISNATIERLIPRIYESAIEPDGWQALLAQFCAALGVTGASLTNTSAVTDLRYWTVVGVEPHLLEGPKENPQEFATCFQQVVTNRWFDGHATTLELWLGRTFLQGTTYYQEILRTNAIRDVSAIFFNMDLSIPAGVEFVQLFRTRQDRAFDAGEMDALRRLAPHLRTAAEVARRVYAVKGIYESLMDGAARPMLLAGPDGRLLRANPAALRILQRNEALRLDGMRLVAALPAFTAELQRKIGMAVTRPGAAAEAAGGLTLALPNPVSLHPLIVTISPLHSAHPMLSDLTVSAVALWLDDPGAQVDPSEDALRIWFGLTPAEARVAIELTNGLSPKEIAVTHNRHIRTVRTQVESVFSKVGVTRVAQLVRVIARASDLAARRTGTLVITALSFLAPWLSEGLSAVLA